MTLPIPARSGGIRPEGPHIFIEPQQGATQGQLLDEFQRAYEIAPGIADVMKAAVDDAPRPSLTFSGSRRHLMEQMVQDPDHGPLHNVGAKLYLGRVPAADFSRFLRSRAEPERSYQLALGVLKDVQLLGFWALEQPGEEITEAALAAALRSAIADQRREYQAVWDGLASSQQRLLKLLAGRPLVSLLGAEALQRIALSPTAVAKGGTVLERSDLIRRGRGGLGADLWTDGGVAVRRLRLNHSGLPECRPWSCTSSPSRSRGPARSSSGRSPSPPSGSDSPGSSAPTT